MSSASNLQPLESPAEKVTADVQMSGAARDHSASIQPASPSESSRPVHLQAQTPLMSSQQQEGKERPTSPTTPSVDQMIEKSKQKLQLPIDLQDKLPKLKSTVSALLASPDRDDGVRKSLLVKLAFKLLDEVDKAHLAALSREMNEARRRASEDGEADENDEDDDDEAAEADEAAEDGEDDQDDEDDQNDEAAEDDESETRAMASANGLTRLASRAEKKKEKDPADEEFSALFAPIRGQIRDLMKSESNDPSIDPTQVDPEHKMFMRRLFLSMSMIVEAKKSFDNARAYSVIRRMERMWREEKKEQETKQEEVFEQQSGNTTSPRPVDPSDPLLAPVTVHVDEDIPLVSDPIFATFSSTVLDFCSAVRRGEIPERVPPELEELTVANTFIHFWVTTTGYYGHFSKEVACDIALNVGDGVVLDPLAGEGFGVKALREAGVRTIASDNSDESQFEQLDALDALKKYGKQISHLLISWAPYDSDIDFQLLREVRSNYPHVTIINVGEDDEGGCTGSEQFWREARRVKPKHPVRYHHTGSVDDTLIFVK